jgi:hypothetical protein
MQQRKEAAVALFDAGSSAYQGTTVTSSVTQVFSTSGLTSPQGVVVMNQGTATVYVGGGSVTSATAIGGTLLPGQFLYYSGAAQNIWAITSAGSATVVAGLATVAAVV